MSRGIAVTALVCLTAFAACGKQVDPPTPYPLSDVVSTTIRELEARIPPPAATATEVLAPDTKDRILGLVESLLSTDARLRGMALADAQSLSSAELDVVAALLADENSDPALAEGAARILGEHKTPASGAALCTALEKSRHASVRRQCAFQFGRVAQSHLVWRLGLRLKYEVDGETAIWLAQALSRYDNLSGLDALRVLFETSRDENVRALAARVGADLATEFGATSAQELESRWNSGAFEASRPPAPVDDRTRLEGWRRIERLSLFDLRQVDDARFSLVALGNWITPELAAALHDANAYTRVHAAQCLERRGARSRAALDSLIEALREPRVAPTAASALASIGDPRAAPALMGALEQKASLDLRVAAARALGNLRTQTALEPLVRAFAANQPSDLRQAAAEALLTIDGRPEAFEYLKNLLATRTGDVDGAEAAIGRHFVARAAESESAGERLNRWTALDVRASPIATGVEIETRQRARSALLEGR